MGVRREVTLDMQLRGLGIEQALLERLRAAKRDGDIRDYFKPDALIIRNDDTIEAREYKAQDMYVAPPFDGHGLPLDQAIRYDILWRQYGIRTKLMVRDQSGLWVGYLDALESGEKYDTAGTRGTPRRIYPIESFRRVLD